MRNPCQGLAAGSRPRDSGPGCTVPVWSLAAIAKHLKTSRTKGLAQPPSGGTAPTQHNSKPSTKKEQLRPLFCNMHSTPPSPSCSFFVGTVGTNLKNASKLLKLNNNSVPTAQWEQRYLQWERGNKIAQKLPFIGDLAYFLSKPSIGRAKKAS